MKYIITLLFFSGLLIACNNAAHEADDQGHGHDHGGVAILLFENGMELFAEADQLYAGHGTEVRAHLTFLENYIPAEDGILSGRIVQGSKVPDWQPMELVQPGIYTGSFLPGEVGSADFQFMYEEDDLDVIFTQQGMKVYTHDDPAPEPPEHGEEIIFTKEQAWKTDFGLMELKKGEFANIIHCSGEVLIPPSGKVDIIAPASGKIAFTRAGMIQGSFVKKGSVLFTILGSGLSHDNILLELSQARTDFERSKSNMERKKKLLEIDAVSAKDFEEAKAEYEQDKARFDILGSQVSEAGMAVKSQISGFISEIHVSDNSFAETGSLLLGLLKPEGIMVKANIPTTKSSLVSSVQGANLRFPGDENIYSMEDFGGQLTSFGHEVDENTGMIPMYFSLSKYDIIAGTFVEMWLRTKTVEDQLVIPVTSLIEEYGQYFVYVQVEGEAYEKRSVRVGETDGKNYVLLSGIEPGEIFVSQGGMAIKIANAMGAAPVHSH